MMHRVFVAVILLAVAGGLASCASIPMEMRYFPEGKEASPRVWPEPPDLPRYRYAGELVGEVNFVTAQGYRAGRGERLVRWLVGLTGSKKDSRRLLRPQSGMVDERGRIYVTDAGRQAVFVFDQDAGELHIWDQADQGGEFLAPVGITAGPGGSVLVADAELGRVVRLAGDGTPQGSFGQGALQRPTGLARDPTSGKVYVTDTAAHDIKVFDAGGELLTVIGERGTQPGQFNGPTHLALDGAHLYVTDSLNARVQVLTPAGRPRHSIGRRGLYVGNLARPKGVTVDTEGHVYVVESYYDHLLVFDQQGQLLLPIGGTGPRVGEFFLPAGAWTDGKDRIFVADMFNGRVMIFQYLGG